MKKLFTCSSLIISFTLIPLLVLSQVNLSSADWNVATANSHATGAVAVDRLDDGDCDGMVVNVIGSIVYIRKASTGALIAGVSTGGEINNTPVLVKLLDGKWYVFVTSDDGKLYKIDALAGIIAATGGASQIVSIRRPTDSGCAEHDKIIASPVVQLKSESNTGYTLTTDIVMVATHHGCSSSTTNMVYAFDAANLTQPPLWVFNQFGDYAVDFCDNFTLDINRNAIFCATNQNSGSSQNTLWRLNTVTGSLDWAGNFSSMHSRPALGNPVIGQVNHLYTVDMLARLHAINPDTGIEDWNLPLTATAGTFDDLPLSLGEGDYAGQIMSTTSAGKIVAVYDGGTAPGDGETLWNYAPAGGVKVKTSCAIMGASGKCYAGLDDGTIRQLNMSTGIVEGYCMPYNSIGAAASSTCAELGMYKTGLRYKIVQSQWGSFGKITQFNIPNFVTNPNLRKWVGGVSSAWEVPGNWTQNMVPDASSDVLIPTGCEEPSFNGVIISSNAICHSLDIQRQGVTITVNPGFTLTVLHQ